MDAQNKERVYEELRSYHLDQFPEAVNNPKVKDLRVEFGALEDQIISMILSLVNGKAEYVDQANDIQEFDEKLHRHIPENHKDGESMDLFASKIAKLRKILLMAKEAEFQLRPVRGFGLPKTKN